VAKEDAEVVDFTNVKDAPDIKPKRLPAGDYAFKILKYNATVTQENKNKMWTFILQPKDNKSATYPYRCILSANSLWKLRNLMVAAGIAVPKKKVRVDPEKLIGREVAGTLVDSEYDGREQSEIDAVFPMDELETDSPGDTDSDTDDSDDDVQEDELDELDVDDI
jgi:hypothetical protein